MNFKGTRTNKLHIYDTLTPHPRNINSSWYEEGVKMGRERHSKGIYSE